MPRPSALTAAVPPSPACPVGLLVREESDRLRRFVSRHVGDCSDADEITQQALVEMSLSYDQFRGDSKPSTWLYGIALNLIRNHLSRAPERRYTFLDIDLLVDEPCSLPGPGAQAEMRETLDLLEQSIAQIPQELRVLLRMICVEEVSYEDAAAKLGMPVGTVRSRLSRARALVRSLMHAHGAWHHAWRSPH
ncbi:MAG: RNA polymerase sigma factor [Achromobacter pestifer]